MQSSTFRADAIEPVGGGLLCTRSSDDESLLIRGAAIATVELTDGCVTVTTTAGRHEIHLPSVSEGGPHPVGLRNSLRGLL